MNQEWPKAQGARLKAIMKQDVGSERIYELGRSCRNCLTSLEAGTEGFVGVTDHEGFAFVARQPGIDDLLF